MKYFGILRERKENDPSVRDRIIEVFEFLCSDFKYLISNSYSPYLDSDYDVVIFINTNTNIQVEISANSNPDKSNRLNIEIVKIQYGYPINYSDFDNYFHYWMLLKLDNSQNESDYWGFNCNQSELLYKGANLIKKHKEFFTTPEWKEIDLFEQLRSYAIKNNYDFKSVWKNEIPHYYQLFRELVKTLLVKNGYALSIDSLSIPAYEKKSANDILEFTKGKDLISIQQYDFRDGKESFSLFRKKKYITSLDVISENAARKAVTEIERIINK